MKDLKLDSTCLSPLQKMKIIKAIAVLSRQNIDYVTIAVNELFAVTYKSNFILEIPKRQYVRLYCSHLFSHIQTEKEFSNLSEPIAKLLKMLSIN
jgi:hypothetical protein